MAGSTVYSIVQDKDGYIWFGTETGLSRFDGTHFKNFYTVDGLPDNEIIKLFVDSKNRVWILPFKNSICYYYKGKIYNQENDPQLRKLKISSEVVSITEDGVGNIVVAEARSIYLISTNGEITYINEFEGKPFTIIKAGLNQQLGHRFVIYDNYMNFFVDLVGHKLLPYRKGYYFQSNSFFTYLGPHLQIYQDADSLIFFNSRYNTEFHMRVPNGCINVSRIDDSSISINTYTGAHLLDLNSHRMVDSFLTNQTVNAVIKDSEGNWWFSTLGTGVYRLGTTDVLNYTFSIKNTVYPVFSIKKTDSTLYIGTDHFFLWTLDPRHGVIHGRQIYSRFSTGRITDIVRTTGKGILLGTDAGVFRLKEGADKPEDLLSQSGGAVKSLILLGDTAVLICTGVHAQIMRFRDRTVIDNIWPARTTCGCSKDGIYYIGTLNGLFAVNRFKKVAFLGDQYPVFKARIAAIKAAPDGTLWVATDGEGIAGYKDGRLTAKITGKEGLTSNICRTIFVSGNDIWIGTDKGLNKITLSAGGYRIYHFSTADGLNSDIINTVYVDGKNVFTGTPEGMTWFNEDKLSHKSICQFRFTGITVAGKAWPVDTTHFVLSHNDNDIGFEFVGISYKSAGDISYRYRIIGLDTGWQTTSQTSLHYPALPSGSYELQIVAINKFGIKSDLKHITFVVDTLFWERPWFQVSVLLLTGILVWSLFHYRVAKIRKKESEKSATASKMAELEQMALRSQMNPHFIFNCLNSIQSYVMDKDTRGANEFITNFSRLIRQTLDISARSKISLEEEIKYISTYLELEKRRFENKFVYTIVVNPDLERETVHIPPLILQPYVENAIRHGIGHRQDQNGHIGIRMDANDDFLVCTIEDNGVGRKLAAQYKGGNNIEYQSQGMALTAKRIDILNSTNRPPIKIFIEDIEDLEGLAAGTRITIYFPIRELTV